VALASGAAGAVAVAITGCATTDPASRLAVPVIERQWRGRFQLLSPQRQSGRFVLLATGAKAGASDQVTLEILTPLGSVAALLQSLPGRAKLQLADGRSFEAQTLETLSMNTLGWSVPLAELPDWLEKLRAGGTVEHPSWRVSQEQSEPMRLLLNGPNAVSIRLLFDLPEG
jgi:outer membrane lipoprotein LolB